jgi:hypothetical protein
MPVQPVMFSVVHVVGSVGIAVKPVFPERLTVVRLVLASPSKLVSPVGKVGNVVSAVHPDKFNSVVSDGIPMIVVRPAPEITNELGKPVHPVRFSVVHVIGSSDSTVKAVSPVRLTLVKMVLASPNKLVSPVGKVGNVVSAGHTAKSNAVVSDGIPMIEVRPGPRIANELGKLVHPVRFSVVHIIGRVGSAVKAVSPVRLTLVSLVEASSDKVIRPVGKVGNVVSAVHPDKFNAVVSDGIPMIEVRPAPASVSELGKPVHPVRFSVVHAAGNVGTAVKPVSPERSTVVRLVEFGKFRVVTVEGIPVSDVIFGGVVRLVTDAGIVGNVVSAVHPAKSTVRVPDSIPMILVSPGPASVSELGKPVHPVMFSVVHAAGNVGTAVKPVSPVRLTLIKLVVARPDKVISPVGKVGNVVSAVHPVKLNAVVSDGIPIIEVRAAPEIVNESDNPVHPVRFSVVHVVGRVGTVVKPVSPVRLTLVSLVELDKLRVVTVEGRPVSDVIFGGVVRLVTDEGIVGNVVSAVHPDKFNTVVSDGIPMIEVRDTLEIVNELGNPVQPVMFSVVHVAGRDGSDVKLVSPVRSTVIRLVEIDKFRVVNDEGMPASEVIFGGVVSLVTVEGIPLNVVRLVELDKSRSVTVEGTPVSDVIFRGVLTLVTVEGIPLNVVSLVENDKSRLVTDEGVPANDVIFGGVSSSVTVEGIPFNVVILVDLDKSSFVTDEEIPVMLPATNARFGGVDRLVTVEGIPFNVVILVEACKFRNVTVEETPAMLPATNARFGGVTRVVTVEGIPLNVVSLVANCKSKTVTVEGIPA